jgi:hypothetical protein
LLLVAPLHPNPGQYVAVFPAAARLPAQSTGVVRAGKFTAQEADLMAKYGSGLPGLTTTRSDARSA